MPFLQAAAHQAPNGFPPNPLNGFSLTPCIRSPLASQVLGSSATGIDCAVSAYSIVIRLLHMLFL